MAEDPVRTPHTLSPLMLVQEFLRDEPWRLLCACIMLNQTSAHQVWQILPEFFERYPDPDALVAADPDDVRDLIRSLGFQNRRCERLLGMTLDWMSGRRPPEHLHGIGKYASDSYRIFIGRYLDQEHDIQDKELRKYCHWAWGLPEVDHVREQAGRTETDHSGSGRVQLYRPACPYDAREEGGQGEGPEGCVLHET
jgi:methyl-CpG-binding domain protein 4